MTETLFLEKIEAIYGIFGRKRPEMSVCAAIFKSISTLPDAFMDFCITHFQDREDMPKNMGMYLLRTLWPEYLERNPNLKSRHEIVCCYKCAPELPGFRKVYDSSGCCHVIRCTCGNAPNPQHERVFTDQELLAWGYVFKQPVVSTRFTKENIMQYLDKANADNSRQKAENATNDNDDDQGSYVF